MSDPRDRALEAARKLADVLDGPSSCQVCRFGYSTFDGKRVPRHSDTCELVAFRAADRAQGGSDA